MLTDVDHSVCHDPSLLSVFKEAGKPSKLPLRHSAPRMRPLLLNYTTGSQRVVCFFWRQKIAGDIYWLCLKWIAGRCVAQKVWGDTSSFFPFILVPHAKPYCEHTFRGEVLSDSLCLGALYGKLQKAGYLWDKHVDSHTPQTSWECRIRIIS